MIKGMPPFTSVCHFGKDPKTYKILTFQVTMPTWERWTRKLTVTWIHIITYTGTEKKVCVRTNPKFHATTNTFILIHDTYVFRLVFLTYI